MVTVSLPGWQVHIAGLTDVAPLMQSIQHSLLVLRRHVQEVHHVSVYKSHFYHLHSRNVLGHVFLNLLVPVAEERKEGLEFGVVSDGVRLGENSEVVLGGRRLPEKVEGALRTEVMLDM